MLFSSANAAAIATAFLFSAAAQAADPNLCAACHGNGGNSVDPALPSIAQQPAQFISTELFMFREGNRKDPQMSPMAAKLSNAEMNELAEFFSSQKAAPPRHRSREESLAAGPRLTKKFNCTQCHGPRLLGQQHIPRLAGQQYQYLKTQLQGFKAGTRADIDGNMTAAAEPLAPLDIELLADYLAGLDPNAGN